MLFNGCVLFNIYFVKEILECVIDQVHFIKVVCYSVVCQYFQLLLPLIEWLGQVWAILKVISKLGENDATGWESPQNLFRFVNLKLFRPSLKNIISF